MTRLVADVGGTKILFGLMKDAETSIRTDLIRTETVKDFYEALRKFLSSLSSSEKASIEKVTIGSAGPTTLERATVTNLGWVIDAPIVRRHFSSNVVVRCHNDMVLQAFGCLHTKKILTIKEGQRKHAPVSILAVGTGLGEGYAVPSEDGAWLAFGSEGGHATFAIFDAEDIGLLDFFTNRYGNHVSWERVVSGIDGFRTLWDYALTKPEYQRVEPILDHWGPQITERARKGCPASQYVLRKISMYFGAETSNHALKIFAQGGVYLSGTVAQALLPEYKTEFFDGLYRKGRFRDFLADVPIYLVEDPSVTLVGGYYA